MSNSTANEVGHLSLYHNPAGLAWDKHFTAGMGFVNHHLLQELNQHAFSLSRSNEKKAFGILFNNYGDKRLQRNTVDLVYSQKFDPRFGVGLKIRFVQISFSDVYGSQLIVHSEIGLKINVSKKVDFAFFISNPSRQMISNELNEAWPGKISSAIKYRFSPLFFMNIELEKNSSHHANLKLALAYKMHQRVSLQGGYNTINQSYSLGLKSKFTRLSICISTKYQYKIGFSPAFTLLYDLKKVLKSGS